MTKLRQRSAGDSTSRLEQVYGAYAAAVRAYVRRRIPAEAVDDVVADVFVTVWRKIDRVPEEPLPWLLGVARRVASNHRRSARRRGALAERLAASGNAPLATDEDSGAVITALASLPETDREVLMLIAWEGLSQREAAAAMDCPAAVFRVRLHRARRKLERALAARVPPVCGTAGISFDLVDRRGETP